MDLVCQDTQLNVSRAYLKPGFAFGGSCLPKDLRATAHLAKQRDVALPMLASILDSNDAHLDLAFDKVMAASAATGSRKVGFVGLSFKTGTDDLRESPLVTLAERLIGKGCDLAIYDPEVHLARLLGANKNFIAQHLPHIGQMLKAELHEVVAASDVIVLGSSSKLVTEALAALLRPGQRVIDLVGLSAGQTLPVPVQGLSW
jgi:GDP-mannose 6-dehydrogenase